VVAVGEGSPGAGGAVLDGEGAEVFEFAQGAVDGVGGLLVQPGGERGP